MAAMAARVAHRAVVKVRSPSSARPRIEASVVTGADAVIGRAAVVNVHAASESHSYTVGTGVPT